MMYTCAWCALRAQETQAARTLCTTPGVNAAKPEGQAEAGEDWGEPTSVGPRTEETAHGSGKTDGWARPQQGSWSAAHTGWSQALWRAPCGSFADRRERPVGGSPDPPFAANAPGAGPRSLCRDVPQAARLRFHGPLRSPHAAHMRLLPGPRPPQATPHQPLGSCSCSLSLLPPFLLLTCHL